MILWTSWDISKNIHSCITLQNMEKKVKYICKFLPENWKIIDIVI